MQERADEVIAELKDVHFDIPGPVAADRVHDRADADGGHLLHRARPTTSAGPGRMWWRVPKGNTEFRTWNELTTVYHEGVPGHHLQVAQTVYRSELLNKWRRLESWTSGHGEGWALYAERLMAELGYMDDPGNRMGWLAGQSLRAARVVIDIGVHCGFDAPDEVGGGAWDYDKAWTYLTRYGFMDEKVLRFELNRYLGWPGQAPELQDRRAAVAPAARRGQASARATPSTSRPSIAAPSTSAASASTRSVPRCCGRSEDARRRRSPGRGGAVRVRCRIFRRMPLSSLPLDSPVPLVLASASPARLRTLQGAGIEPTVLVSEVDEDLVLAEALERDGPLEPGDIALLLARAKAEDVATRTEIASVVLGCDSVLELDGEVHGKPAHAAEAVDRWRRMRGRSGVLHTGHWLIDDRDTGGASSRRDGLDDGALRLA